VKILKPIKVLMAKAGLDGHDRGAKVVSRALREAGMEVIYMGLHNLPEDIVSAALQEDVDVIGLSILSGAHNSIVSRIEKLLKEKGMKNVTIIVGGIIPDDDIPGLMEMGVRAVFTPGANMDNIVATIKDSVARE